MALLLFFAAFVLAAVAPAAGQRKGFLSIDCGLETGPYTDKDRGIDYVPDGPYVDAGENHAVASELKIDHILPDLTVRSFPSGMRKRNCYTLPTEAGSKYLVRVVAFYGNYDGQNNSSGLQFNLHLGTNYWDTVQPDRRQVYEALFVAWASWAPVCLVNIDQGTPFASSVELRPLGTELYPTVMANQSIRLYTRKKLGPTTARITRYPNDRLDRYWWPNTNPMWENLSTALTNIRLESSFEVPLAILENAVQVARNGTILNITWTDDTGRHFAVFLHFADFQNSQVREFDFYYVNSGPPYKYSPRYLAAGYIYSNGWYRATDGKFNVTLAATAESVLPPMLNAYEIYSLIIHDTPTTFLQDADAIMAIKLEYGIKKNWTGDPCFPVQFKWDGVECRNISDNISRIISIDLSNSNLHGVISSNFTLLTALDYLNLSGNQLNGPIPDSLCKLNEGSLIFSYGSNGDVCNKINLPRSKKRAAILAISIAAPVLVVVSLFIAYLIWRAKGKSNISAPRSEKYHWDRLRKTENRHFTYEELKKLTDNFQHFIGEGGFGCVYRGYLEDKTEVAVKIRSEKSSHGFNEFLAEVESLTKVRHKNLVSLVGYCWEKAHLALVYEYMPKGNLFDLLRGYEYMPKGNLFDLLRDKTGLGESLNWAMRVRVLLDAAQGLDYLHTGCNRPIIHRDVKTSNILLDQNLQAKIADFGLSKIYLSDTQSGMLATVAGTMGYIDPVYHATGMVTESSDVYSFGVVLLEVATGQRPILQGNGHIIQRVKEKVASGDISSIADERLKGDYNVRSMWKVVEIALLCTEPLAAQRPSMTTVVVQMKESLALEVARDDRGLQANPKGDAVATSSTFDPSAR